jgi:3-methyladenine DNA glycosylase AlkD
VAYEIPPLRFGATYPSGMYEDDDDLEELYKSKRGRGDAESIEGDAMEYMKMVLNWMLNSIYKSRKIGLPHHLGKKKVRKCNL